MKHTTVKISEIAAHPTMRIDAGYWLKKKKIGPGGPGRVGPQGRKNLSRKKNIYFYLTKWREYGTIPYNLNERINYGLFSTKNTS